MESDKIRSKDLEEWVDSLLFVNNNKQISDSYLSSFIPKNIIVYGKKGSGKSKMVNDVVNAMIDNAKVCYLSVKSLLIPSALESDIKTKNALKMIKENEKHDEFFIAVVDDLQLYINLSAGYDLNELNSNYGDVNDSLYLLTRCKSIMTKVLTSAKHTLGIMSIENPSAEETINLNVISKSTGILFQKSILVSLPSEQDRFRFLKSNSSINVIFNNDKSIQQLSKSMNGFNYYQLTQFIANLDEYVQKEQINNKEDKDIERDIVNMLKNVSTLEIISSSSEFNQNGSELVLNRTFGLSLDSLRWNGVAGYQAAKDRLEQLIKYQWLNPEKLSKLGVRPTTGILLHGPSGCGKSFIVSVLSQSVNCNFVSVKVSDIFSKWLGESEASIRSIFSKARSSPPCIIFLDEIDALASNRAVENEQNVGSRVLSTLLNEMDGINTNVASDRLLILAATNRIDMVDSALIRQGRLGTNVHIPLPSFDDRVCLFQEFLKDKPLSSDLQIELLASISEESTCADIKSLCTEACISAIRKSESRGVLEVKEEDFFE